MSLPDDLRSALGDGVVLCHLANHVRPRAVSSIHVPSPAVVSRSRRRPHGGGTGAGERALRLDGGRERNVTFLSNVYHFFVRVLSMNYRKC